ncbi:Mobile element protein [Dissulfuribacter thermophilus]|uniref:Mobile element protein n=1 Tax=Dissulfuribacter thermophilus TaxID=1156395 RepID=A0A1B9F2M9_9BACT|nr:Mobile element protein [Dissulfuribacter thermophilus]
MLDFLNHLEKAFPQSWRRSIQGVLSLGQSFDPDVLNKACERAIVFGAISYRSVKRICENGLYVSSDTRGSTVTGSGFANDLSIYDRLAGGEGPWK